MNRRGFLQATIAAPFVITTPGLLMPVRKLIVPVLRPYQQATLTWIDSNPVSEDSWVLTRYEKSITIDQLRTVADHAKRHAQVPIDGYYQFELRGYDQAEHALDLEQWFRSELRKTMGLA